MSPARPLGTGITHMERREGRSSDRWIIFKLPKTSPESWAAGPGGTGVYARIETRQRWLLFPSLIEAADYARDCTDTDRRHATALAAAAQTQEQHP